MRCVIQRVSSASVVVRAGEAEVYPAEIGIGFLVLIAVRSDDTEADANYLAEKVAGLRVFEDAAGKMNLSLLEVGGAAIVVSNFTLYGDCRKGKRPSFTEAAAGELAERLYIVFGSALQARGVQTEYGRFGADMQVSLVNAGPVTILLDSRKQF